MATVLITGAGAGIGLATTLTLAGAGHKVFATMRNPSRAPEFPTGLPIEIRTLDVDSDDSVRACFAGIAEPIDVLVNNAGIETHGAVEETPIADFAAVMNTNYLGAVRCIQAVLPRMRAAGKGCIVNVASVAGKVASSPLGAYAASKFALEAVSEALAGEVKSLGIRVAIVEPGIQDTKMARAISHSESIYPQPRRFAGLFRASLANPIPPDATAEVIRRIIESETWQLRHTAGPDAPGLLAWRASMTDEQWVDLSAMDDESWYTAIQNAFGLDARPQTRAATE